MQGCLDLQAYLHVQWLKSCRSGRNWFVVNRVSVGRYRAGPQGNTSRGGESSAFVTIPAFHILGAARHDADGGTTADSTTYLRPGEAANRPGTIDDTQHRSGHLASKHADARHGMFFLFVSVLRFS